MLNVKPGPLPKSLQAIMDVVAELGGTASINGVTDMLLNKGAPATANNVYQRLHRLMHRGTLVRLRPGFYCLPDKRPPAVSVKESLYAELKRHWPEARTLPALSKAFQKEHQYAVLPDTLIKALRELRGEDLVIEGRNWWRCAARP